MTADTHVQRHALAMLAPIGRHEETVTALFVQLTKLADRYANDSVMIRVVEHIASAIIIIAGDGQETGSRLDPGLIDKQVRDVVARAGGDADEV